jgi:6-phosphofructokinase 1
MKHNIQSIAVLTSGGDAPGMNAAIRAVVRSALFYKLKVFGITRGYQGMINDEIEEMNSRSVSNIIQRGGTILKSARSMDFKTPEGMEKAYQNLKKRNIDALVVIGGDGTFTGAHVLYQKYNVPVIGVPGTIDNDLNGTDFTIGFDTATNTAIEAIDKIRDSASSHSRLFFVEVMGRDAGYIALGCAIAAGAEAMMVPEQDMTIDHLINLLERGSDKKTSSIVVVAEGGKLGGAVEVAKKVSERFDYYDTKVAILGHLQRGGSPSFFDRQLASRMGVAAVEGLMQGYSDVMTGINNNKVSYIPFEIAIRDDKGIDHDLIRIANILSF